MTWLTHYVKRHKCNLIHIIIDDQIEYSYGVKGDGRGRELAERDLKTFPTASAYYIDSRGTAHPLPWTTGRHNDRFIDSENLPERARIAAGYR